MYGLVQVIWTGWKCEDGVDTIKVSMAIILEVEERSMLRRVE